MNENSEKNISGNPDSQNRNITGDQLQIDNQQPQRRSASSGAVDMQFATALDMVTLPNPESAKMTRYADFPVSPSLGTADISIPIYEINTGRIRVPIGLQYNTSGIKVTETSGLVGLGWHLNAGGVITRTVCGVPDGTVGYLPIRDRIDATPGTSCTNVYGTSEQWKADTLKEYAEQGSDTQYDRYSYSFLGHTGSFIIVNNEIVPLNATDLIIERISGGFRITDTAGTEYEFTEQETSSRTVLSISPTPLAPSNTQGMGYDVNTETGWLLKKIRTMDGTDEVTFTYESLSEFITQHQSFHKTYQLSYRFMKNDYSGTHWWKYQSMNKTFYGSGETPDITHSDWTYLIEDGFRPKAVKTITFRGGTVSFENAGNQINSSSNVRRSYYQHLESITVRNAAGSTVLKAEMSYANTRDMRELLTRVTFKGSNNTETDRRVMTYYSQDANILQMSQDLFGYHNGASNTTLVPFNLFPDIYTINETCGDRSYSASHAQALSLESITTGSGAVTTLFYEGNTVPGGTGTVLPVIGIGIRIARIVTKDGNAVVRVRRFTYSESALTIPIAAFSHERFITASESNVMIESSVWNPEITNYHTWEGLFGPERNLTVTIGDQSSWGGAPLESAVIVHGRVSERIENPSGSEWTRTEYTFDTYRCVKRTIGNSESLPYSHDDDYITDSASSSWGFHMYQRIPMYITRRYLPSSVRISEPEVIFEDGSSPMMNLPTCVKTYCKDASEAERLVLQTDSEYRLLDETVRTGYSVRCLLSMNMSGYQDTNYCCVGDYRQTEYVTRKYHARLERSVVTTYNDDGSSSTVETTHSYVPLLRRENDSVLGLGADPGYTFPEAGDILPPRATVIRIDGDSERTYKRYTVFPQDYSGPSVPQYITDLMGRHFRQPVGEEVYWKGDPFSIEKEFDGRFIHYGTFSPDGNADAYVLPYEQWTYRNGDKVRTGDGGAYIPDYRINSYDRYGNPTEMQEAGKPVTSYIWGYNGLYPVAEIVGLDISSVRGYHFTIGRTNWELGTLMDSALTLTSPSSNLWTGLASLRDSSAGVLVTILKHTPLVGPIEVTGPSGKSVLSSYDSAGRLSHSRNRGAGQTGSGSLTESWTYDFLRTDGTTNSTTRRVFTDAAGTTSSARTTVSRFDGLGRTVQASLVGASTSGGDIIQPFRPDFLDREDAESFLPYSEPTSNSGAYRSNAIIRQAAFHDSQYGSGMGDKALSRKIYENSRSGRVKASVLPGHSSAIRTETSTSLSGLQEVLRIECPSSQAALSVHSSGWWPAGRFRKSTTTGPDGSVTEVFTNEFGSPVLERKLISRTAGTDSADWACTYYIRDARDRVACVVPPDVAHGLGTAASGSPGIDACYLYTYDDLDRVLTRKLPRSLPTSYTYRPDGQVLTETTGSRVFITGYDSLGRIISRKYRYGSSGVEVMLAEYGYDGYPGSSLNGVSFLAESGFDQTNCPYVKGLKTWEHVMSVDPDKTESSYGSSIGSLITRAFFYDARGRLIQSAERNIMGQISRVSTKYDFNDNPVSVKETHAVTTSLSVSATTTMTYDREGRLTSSITTLGGVESRVTYQYDSVGRLLARTLGSEASPADMVTDSYTIQGWLKQRASAKFTSQLMYEDPVHASTSGLPGFAGNITEWKTYRNGSTASGATYAFTYDLLSRLTSSLRYAGNSNTATSPYTEQGIAYDRTGKIKSLARYGSAASQVENISTVNSAGNDLSTYDQYRNMTLDAHTGSAMQWNILNMVRKVTPSGGSAAKYTFLADGTKARVSSGSGTYLYLGSMVFSIPSSGSPAFESMAVAEGRIIATSSGNEVRYHITDHLGSVRTVLKADGTVVAENDFYPFGKRIPTGTAGGNAYRHTFSGKEDQSKTPAGCPYIDFGARMYSPETGSWLSVDPMAENYYGFGLHAYCAGNPVNLIDYNGKEFTERSWFFFNLLTQLAYEELVWQTQVGGSIEDYLQIFHELDVLSKSDQVYDAFYDSSMNTETEIRSGVEYNFDNNYFEIKLADDNPGLLAHEFLHAFQFEIGEFSSGHSGSGSPLYDLTDEYNAYKRGELFGGDCYSQMKIQSMYPKLKETRATEKQQLENMPDIGRQKIASQYKTAFRVKGKTYRY